jgi:hypothetical protein
MRLYLVNFDNGYDYSDNENYDVAVFDSYEKAEKFCLSKGYEETEIKGLFQKKHVYKYYTHFKYSLSIIEVKLNEQFEDVGCQFN